MTDYTPYDVLTYENTDVSHRLAQDAHRGTSFVPEQRANQECNGYMRQMAYIAETFARFATDDNIDELRADLEAYRAEYAKRTEAHWRARAACVSTMIAGASNFNVSRAEKANERAHKELEAMIDWNRKAMDRLHSKYDPARIASRPISADDDDAPALLREKIAAAEAKQERMKAANKIARNTKLTEQEKREFLRWLAFSEGQIDSLLHPDWGRPGFASFELTNNNANIRRMQARLAALEAERARKPGADTQAAILSEPVTIVENADENRLQLLFDGKPSAEVRDLLKSRGFRWAPSQKAWQRQLNNNARAAVRQLTEVNR